MARVVRRLPLKTAGLVIDRSGSTVQETCSLGHGAKAFKFVWRSKDMKIICSTYFGRATWCEPNLNELGLRLISETELECLKCRSRVTVNHHRPQQSKRWLTCPNGCNRT